MQSLYNVFWLGTKELRAVLADPVMVLLLVFVFTGMVYMQSNAISDNVNHASIAIVDEDGSALSRQIANAFYPPFFQRPVQISPDELGPGLDRSRFLFALSIPPDFEADLRRGAQPELQIDIDATAVLQAGLGDGYIQSIVQAEVQRFVSRSDAALQYPVLIEVRRAFNPNGIQSWFGALTAVLDFVSIVTILLSGAALIREREHGTIEHLMVMPLRPAEIAFAKIWANGLIVLVAFFLSMRLVVEAWLNVPVAGSYGLLLGGTALYLFAASSIGILLGTLARTMSQFALLVMMVVLPIMLLSGGLSPIESQPDLLQPVTALLPSRHYMAFAQAVVFRGAGLETVWPQLLWICALGSVVLGFSLSRFRKSMSM